MKYDDTNVDLNNVQLSEEAIEFYGINEENIQNIEKYGEVKFIINNFSLIYNFNWYNINNDIKDNELVLFNDLDTLLGELWGKMTTSTLPDSLESRQKMNSGWKHICLSPISYFPVLIHKNDINKITDIGPFIKEDGTETNIHLVII